MRWETAVAIVLTPLAADLLRRWQNYEKPFDGSWTIAWIIKPLLPLLGQKSGRGDAGGTQVGGQELGALPPPLAHQEVTEQPTVEGSSCSRSESSSTRD